MSNITRNIPDGSTQAEIDAIVNEMILECATAIAQSRAVPCPGAPIPPPPPPPPPPDFTTLVIQGYFDGMIPNPTGD